MISNGPGVLELTRKADIVMLDTTDPVMTGTVMTGTVALARVESFSNIEGLGFTGVVDVVLRPWRTHRERAISSLYR